MGKWKVQSSKAVNSELFLKDMDIKEKHMKSGTKIKIQTSTRLKYSLISHSIYHSSMTLSFCFAIYSLKQLYFSCPFWKVAIQILIQ